MGDRITFFTNWKKEVPKSFWFSGFFFPQCFLTGLLQTYARANAIPIGDLALDHILDKDDINGTIIHGLFIHNARWCTHTKTLVEPTNSSLIEQAPSMCLKPCLKKEIIKEKRYICPVYNTFERRELLTN